MSLFSYLIWNASPKIIPGFERSPVWYGLLFAMSFLISQQILVYIYKKEGKNEKDIDTLTVFIILGTIIGARLGHVFFYEPARYLSNPIDIIKIWEGGLASHGAAISIPLATWLYTRYKITFSGGKFKSQRITRKGQNFLQVLDRLAIVVAISGCLIRFGNFTNSEIYGHPTQSEYGVVYMRHITESLMRGKSALEGVDYEKDEKGKASADGYVPIKINLTFKKNNEYTEDYITEYLKANVRSILSTSSDYIAEHIHQPADQKLEYEINQESGQYHAIVKTYAKARHPTQLYESSSYLLLFFFLFFLWSKKKADTPTGRIFGWFLFLLFTMRFFHEYLKENQVAFENNIPLNMGQLLSIPLVIIGIVILIRSNKGAHNK